MTTNTADEDMPIRISSDSHPLHWAAANGCTDLARYLAESYYDVNEQEALQGTTPLFWAAAAGHVHVARLLIENGASVKVANRHGVTPLHAAVEGGNADMARLLIRHGASIRATDFDGWTPLDWAKSFGHDEIVKVFEEVAYRESGARKRDELARAAKHGRAIGE
jgi:ankyrin repeat protein